MMKNITYWLTQPTPDGADNMQVLALAIGVAVLLILIARVVFDLWSSRQVYTYEYLVKFKYRYEGRQDITMTTLSFNAYGDEYEPSDELFEDILKARGYEWVEILNASLLRVVKANYWLAEDVVNGPRRDERNGS